MFALKEFNTIKLKNVTPGFVYGNNYEHCTHAAPDSVTFLLVRFDPRLVKNTFEPENSNTNGNAIYILFWGQYGSWDSSS